MDEDVSIRRTPYEKAPRVTPRPNRGCGPRAICSGMTTVCGAFRAGPFCGRDGAPSFARVDDRSVLALPTQDPGRRPDTEGELALMMAIGRHWIEPFSKDGRRPPIAIHRNTRRSSPRSGMNGMRVRRPAQGPARPSLPAYSHHTCRANLWVRYLHSPRLLNRPRRRAGKVAAMAGMGRLDVGRLDGCSCAYSYSLDPQSSCFGVFF